MSAVGAATLGVSGTRMRTTDHGAEHAVSSQDVVDVVVRAEALGFCRWCVATALGMSAWEFEAIEWRAKPPGSDRVHCSRTQRPPR